MARYLNTGRDVNGGWVKIWRQIFDHPTFKDPYCDGMAWVWLIAHADHRPSRRGEVVVSLGCLSRKWGWSVSRVRRFLARLARENMVQKPTYQPTQEATYLSICNFDKYQAQPHSIRHSNRHLYKKKKEAKEENTSKEVCAPDVVSVAFSAWNDMASRIGLPVATKLTPKRRAAITARLVEHDSSGWYRALNAVEQSAFLRGQGGGREGWTATLDFLCQASSFQKLLEGNYGNGAARSDHNSLDHYDAILAGEQDRGH